MQGRPFSQSTLPGRSPGRPATAAAEEPSRAARALIATKRWQRQQDSQGGNRGDFTPPPRRSFQDAAETAAIKGQARRSPEPFAPMKLPSPPPAWPGVPRNSPV